MDIPSPSSDTERSKILENLRLRLRTAQREIDRSKHFFQLHQPSDILIVAFHAFFRVFALFPKINLCFVEWLGKD